MEEERVSTFQARRISYPPPLPMVRTFDTADETGFTNCEKVALRNALRVLRRRFRSHAFQIFLDFFTKHDKLLERFCGHNGNFYMNSLNQHPLSVLKIYGRLVEEGLDNSALINIMLAEVVMRHKMVSVVASEIELYTKGMEHYFVTVLKDISSPTLEKALRKMADIINEYHTIGLTEDGHLKFKLKKPSIPILRSQRMSTLY